jgi:hypothetical protein
MEMRYFGVTDQACNQYIEMSRGTLVLKTLVTMLPRSTIPLSITNTCTPSTHTNQPLPGTSKELKFQARCEGVFIPLGLPFVSPVHKSQHVSGSTRMCNALAAT